jgi:hypothetical protein
MRILARPWPRSGEGFITRYGAAEGRKLKRTRAQRHAVPSIQPLSAGHCNKAEKSAGAGLLLASRSGISCAHLRDQLGWTAFKRPSWIDNEVATRDCTGDFVERSSRAGPKVKLYTREHADFSTRSTWTSELEKRAAPQGVAEVSAALHRH